MTTEDLDALAEAIERSPLPRDSAMTLDELVVRLRACANGIGSLKSRQGDFGLCDDAADMLLQLRAENERSREGLAAQEAAEDARDSCSECGGDGQWEHCGICAVSFGNAIVLRRSALSHDQGEG